MSLFEGEESLHGALLADDMGLGKTYMALVAIAEYYLQCRQKNIVERPVLIVVPLTLLENWKEEIEQTFQEIPFIDIVILQSDAHLNRYRREGAGIEIRQEAIKEFLEDDNSLKIPEDAIRYSLKIGKEYKPDNLDVPRRVVLTTYQTLRDYQFSLCRIDWSFVVFDEAQNIKNPNTLAARAAKGLKAKFKLLATGTPVENNLGEFWCLMDTARPGTLGSYQDFRQEYMTPIRRSSSNQVLHLRETLGKNLRNKVGALMLRRLKEDNLPGLPRKYIYSGIKSTNGNGYIYEPLLEREMQGEQLQRYNTIIDTVLELQQQENTVNPVLSGLHQLREVTLHPLLLNGGVLPTPRNAKEARELLQLSGKLRILLDILDQIKKREDKVIIFLINKRLQSLLKIALGIIYNYTVEIINGDTKAISKSKNNANKTRKGIIDDFQAKNGFGIIIMSPIAAGVGLTVTAANNVIHLERHWNPAKEDQATDRVYRIGQEKDVKIYLPIINHPSIDSFDVNLHTLLSNKIILKDAVVTPEEVTNEEMGKASFRTTIKDEDQERPLRGNDLSFLSWQEFEALCAELYGQHLNSDAFLTPTNDLGADVVTMGKENVLIQCKHTSNYKYNSLEPLIQIHSAKPAYEEKTGKVFQSLIVAVSGKKFSRKVIAAAQTYNVTLVCQRELDKLLKQYVVTRKNIQRRLFAPRIFDN
ncbi:MAG TPA: SNF2-related protein [Saccharofermentans sp.]|nr:SNF2-related protein [Saccharofermentans sp.]